MTRHICKDTGKKAVSLFHRFCTRPDHYDLADHINDLVQEACRYKLKIRVYYYRYIHKENPHRDDRCEHREKLDNERRQPLLVFSAVIKRRCRNYRRRYKVQEQKVEYTNYTVYSDYCHTLYKQHSRKVNYYVIHSEYPQVEILFDRVNIIHILLTRIVRASKVVEQAWVLVIGRVLCRCCAAHTHSTYKEEYPVKRNVLIDIEFLLIIGFMRSEGRGVRCIEHCHTVVKASCNSVIVCIGSKLLIYIRRIVYLLQYRLPCVYFVSVLIYIIIVVVEHPRALEQSQVAPYLVEASIDIISVLIRGVKGIVTYRIENSRHRRKLLIGKLNVRVIAHKCISIIKYLIYRIHKIVGKCYADSNYQVHADDDQGTSENVPDYLPVRLLHLIIKVK